MSPKTPSSPRFVLRDQALDAFPAPAAQGALLKAQTRFFRALKRRLRSGRYDRAWLRPVLAGLAEPAAGPEAYDALDVLGAGLLAGEAPAAPVAELTAEEVAYQPTPARVLLALIEMASLGPDSRFVDLGSGLGLPALWVALLSGAHCQGIEKEPSYVEHARRSAEALGLGDRCSFTQGDLLTADLGQGTHYHLYTPLRGSELIQLLQRLEALAARQPFTLSGLGPCVGELDRCAWLKELAWKGELAVYGAGIRPR